MMSNHVTREERVNEFFVAAGNEVHDVTDEIKDVFLNVIEEETGEFFEAAYEYEEALLDGDASRVDTARRNLCKEWADMQYVVSQAAIYFEIPADPSFNRVHESNMTKVVDGKLIKREDGKVLKPDTYRAPDMRGL